MSSQQLNLPSSEAASLSDDYAFRRDAEVEAFLQANPFLTPLLQEAAPHIRRYFGPATSIVLEVVHEPEGGKDSDMLFAFVQSHASTEETLANLDSLDEGWWIDASPQAQGKLMLSVEYA